MNKLDRQSQMMDHLYGEMTDQERLEYERWLEQHPETRREIEEMQTTRAWMAEVEEVAPQSVVIQLSPKSNNYSLLIE